MRVIERTRKIFGAESVRGALSHRALDENLDHVEVISQVLEAIVRDDDELIIATRLLDVVSELISEYFCELTAWNRDCLSAIRHRHIPDDHEVLANL